MLFNKIKQENKGSDGCPPAVIVPKVKVDGKVLRVEMNGTETVIDDYSFENLDKAGITLQERDPQNFSEPSSMDMQDNLRSAVPLAEKYIEQLNSQNNG